MSKNLGSKGLRRRLRNIEKKKRKMIWVKILEFLIENEDATTTELTNFVNNQIDASFNNEYIGRELSYMRRQGRVENVEVNRSIHVKRRGWKLRNGGE